MSRMLSKMNLISVVQKLPKEDIETIQGYVEMIEEENEELKKQLENKYEKVGTLTNEILYEENTKLINQQKEFINWLKAMSKMYEEQYEDIDIAEHYNCVEQKYKEIIGVSDEKTN